MLIGTIILKWLLLDRDLFRHNFFIDHLRHRISAEFATPNPSELIRLLEWGIRDDLGYVALSWVLFGEGCLADCFVGLAVDRGRTFIDAFDKVTAIVFFTAHVKRHAIVLISPTFDTHDIFLLFLLHFISRVGFLSGLFCLLLHRWLLVRCRLILNRQSRWTCFQRLLAH